MIYILVIDSNRDRQRWFKGALGVLQDCQVDAATGSHSALLHIRGRRYDLVMLDDFLGSDSKTGLQLIEEVLNNPASFFRPKRVWIHTERETQGAEIALKVSGVRVPVLRRPFSEFSRGTAFMDKMTDWLGVR